MLSGSLRDEAEGGFVDATRGMCELWSDSVAELLESAKSLKGELRYMLRTGRYEEGAAEAVAYAYGRDLGLAWMRRRDDCDICDDCERSFGPGMPCRCSE